MIQTHILSREGHGRYALENGHEYKSKTVTQQMESRIAAVLRLYGGIARTGDIHKALWDRPKGEKDRPYAYQLVARTLAKSPQFHQAFGRGFWNLSEGERLGLPLLGRWVAICQDGQIESRDRFYQEVGCSFATARGDMEVSQATQDAEVRAALKLVAISGNCRSVALGQPPSVTKPESLREV
jgi:hypothetical protein